MPPRIYDIIISCVTHLYLSNWGEPHRATKSGASAASAERDARFIAENVNPPYGRGY